MRSSDVPAGREPAGHASVSPAHFRASLPRLRVFSLSNWPVSRRLIVVIVIAMVMGVIFGSLRIAGATDTAAGFSRTTQLAVLGERTAALAQAMENERDLTAGLCAASPGGNCPSPGEKLDQTARTLRAEVQRAQAVTNAAAGQVKTLAAAIDTSLPVNTQTKAAEVVAMIGHIGSQETPGVRTLVAAQPAAAVIDTYSQAIGDLFNLNDEITSGSGDPALADEVRTLGALSRAKDEISQERAIFYAALLQGSLGNALQSLTTAQGLEDADLNSFQTSATQAEETAFVNAFNGQKMDTTQLLNSFLTVTGTQLTPAQAFAQALSNAHLPGQAVGAAKEPGVWYSTMTDTITRMRSVEQQVAAGIVDRSRSLEQGARASAELTAAVTGAVLLLVLFLTFIVARSMVDPLRRLQADALEIATLKLPGRVAALSEATDPDVSLDVEPIGVHSTDEIGKVARAFDQVHHEAVRLAGNEAMLRGSLNAMFISLSRRSVPLIERLTRMIDTLEQNEDDPDRLSSLFSMDHLVTRMRRNSENLLVLAGEEPVRKWSEPVPLTDVTRAATSEIEQYSRIVLNIQPGIVVSGQAASDIVHLLAEIIENATMFSPRDTPVHVSGQEIASGGVLAEVRDNGVGVTPARLDEMNWRLDNPPVVDVSVSRHMGLFAVSRLAARHGVRVRLRAASPQGLSALIWLPGSLTGREAARPVGPWPRQPASQAAAAQLSVGGRRVPSWQSLELRAAGQKDDSTDGYQASGPTMATSPAAAPSNWFRAKRASSASARAAVTDEVIDSGSDTGTGTGIGTGAPVRGDQTPAGLPSRIPGANLFSGSAASAASEAWGPGETPVVSARKPSRGTEEAAQARNRLSGFQLGSRQAEGWTSSKGEGS
jgi:signal transduction histidine kinase